MLIRHPSYIASSEITPREAYLRRREFLAGAAALGLGAGLSAAFPGMRAQAAPLQAAKSPLSTTDGTAYDMLGKIFGLVGDAERIEIGLSLDPARGLTLRARLMSRPGSQLEAVSRAQLEAARTLGFSEGQILRLIRGPQAFRYALAPMTNDFVALLKDSSLVSVITVVELTKQTAIFATNIGSWVLPGVLCAAIYLAMSLPLSRLARRLERRWSATS